MSSKYPMIWTTLDGRKLTLEEMETDHLLNVYKHIEFNLTRYIEIYGGKENFCKAAHRSWESLMEEYNSVRNCVKQELLSRGILAETIENHIEDRSKIMENQKWK